MQRPYHRHGFGVEPDQRCVQTSLETPPRRAFDALPGLAFDAPAEFAFDMVPNLGFDTGRSGALDASPCLMFELIPKRAIDTCPDRSNAGFHEPVGTGARTAQGLGHVAKRQSM